MIQLLYRVSTVCVFFPKMWPEEIMMHYRRNTNAASMGSGIGKLLVSNVGLAIYSFPSQTNRYRWHIASGLKAISYLLPVHTPKILGWACGR